METVIKIFDWLLVVVGLWDAWLFVLACFPSWMMPADEYAAESFGQRAILFALVLALFVVLGFVRFILGFFR